jgi:hypothetical protein
MLQASMLQAPATLHSKYRAPANKIMSKTVVLTIFFTLMWREKSFDATILQGRMKR